MKNRFKQFRDWARGAMLRLEARNYSYRVAKLESDIQFLQHDLGLSRAEAVEAVKKLEKFEREHVARGSLR